jgi:CheY-like chemotaxis protein
VDAEADLVGRRILVVDDNATNRQILARQLGAWGVQVALAESGAVALGQLRVAAASGRPFDLAILDMQMPTMDGLMLAVEVRADQRIAQTPLALLTSLGQPGARGDQSGLDFAGVLTKPVRQSQLRAWLGRVLGAPTRPPAPRQESATPARPVSADHAVPRILVAEDNVVNQRVVVKTLERLGYRVDVVANGVEAVDAVARLPYAAVLMDCQMPELDGYEATRAIRAWERAAMRGGQRLPIIALTANALATDREQCLASGMDDYLAKPLRPETLATTLERWLQPSDVPAALPLDRAAPRPAPPVTVELPRMAG